MTCTINSKTFGKGIPQSIFYIQDNKYIEKNLPGGNLSFCVVFIKGESNNQAILLDRQLANSMLIRLYFFNGVGLKYFKPLVSESDMTKRTVIKAFEVDWKKFNEDQK